MFNFKRSVAVAVLTMLPTFANVSAETKGRTLPYKIWMAQKKKIDLKTWDQLDRAMETERNVAQVCSVKYQAGLNPDAKSCHEKWNKAHRKLEKAFAQRARALRKEGESDLQAESRVKFIYETPWDANIRILEHTRPTPGGLHIYPGDAKRKVAEEIRQMPREDRIAYQAFLQFLDFKKLHELNRLDGQIAIETRRLSEEYWRNEASHGKCYPDTVETWACEAGLDDPDNEKPPTEEMNFRMSLIMEYIGQSIDLIRKDVEYKGTYLDYLYNGSDIIQGGRQRMNRYLTAVHTLMELGRKEPDPGMLPKNLSPEVYNSLRVQMNMEPLFGKTKPDEPTAERVVDIKFVENIPQ